MSQIKIVKGEFKFDEDVNEELSCRLCGKDNAGRSECECGMTFENN